MSEGKKTRDDVNNDNLEGIAMNLPTVDCRLSLCYKEMVSWMTGWGTTVTGTVLSDMAFRDFCVSVTMLPPP